MPCMRCRSGGTICTYERLGSASPSGSSNTEVGAHPSHPETGTAEPSSGGESGRISIDFLLNFTNPLGYGPSTAIAAEASALEMLDTSADVWSPQIRLKDDHMIHNLPSYDLNDPSSVFLGFSSMMPEREDWNVFPLDGDYLAPLPETTSTLAIRTREMVGQLFAQQRSMMESDSTMLANFDAALAEMVFTVANVNHFIWGFFHYFHDQFPILHEPTFDAQTASLPLLLAIVLVGSMSFNPSDMSIAIRQFYDAGEAYVFELLVSKQTMHCLQEANHTVEQVELLQAGLLLLMLQNNSENLTTRRRIRLQRTPALVAAVRCSGLFAYKRQHVVGTSDRSGWRDFILDETRVKLAAWTFMTDCILAVFFNSAPRVALSDMTGDLPCEEPLYRAKTALEFEQLLCMRHPRPSVSTLSQLLSLVYSAPVSGTSIRVKEHVTASNMLVLICALLSVIMTLRMNFVASATVEPIHGAIHGWKSLWDTLHQDAQDGVAPLMGFERHAADYWWLAKMLLKVGQEGDQSCRYMQLVPCDSVKDLHEFIRKYRDYEG
ncbi:hypothetical protein CC86DRAFT_413014 [Ophiobolus disseminans]|uniref:Xylanolytic transcriptional activator regulatory domain-containing protein n=1 Tax=Ophiobolus disseminans TaxID=1469910 RepID=A0A6A6ZF35_9PLEO|nr:hypothetical protein CC86DRAFT_413014 [Ophiobolus disseminans]